MIARHEELACPARPGLPSDTPPPATAAHSDPIAAWLDVLGSLLRLPAPEKQALRDELENHLRERVRDLMVTGLNETEAAGKAVGELGEAANLAREFRAARTTPIRRTLMNLAVIGLAAGGLVTGLIGLTGGLKPSPVAVSVFQPPVPLSPAPRAVVRFNDTQEVPWPDLFKFLGESAGMPVYVHWPSLQAIGGQTPVEEGSPVQLRLKGELTLDRAVDLINDDLDLKSDNRIDFRVRDGRLIFASTPFFDRQETVLATYDLGDLVNQRTAQGVDESTARKEVIEQVSALITTLVHSDQWADNGGDLATLTHYGTKLFVKAPKRFHPQIEWILAEVGTGPEKKEQGRARADSADADPVVIVYAVQHTSTPTRPSSR